MEQTYSLTLVPDEQLYTIWNFPKIYFEVFISPSHLKQFDIRIILRGAGGLRKIQFQVFWSDQPIH